MNDNSGQQILEKISKSQNILIVAAKKSGFDGLASALALYLSFKKLDKNTSIIASEPTASDAKSLYAVDKIGKSESQKNLIISVNNAVDNVDKVTYSLEGSILKIIVHALPGSQGVKTEDVNFDISGSSPGAIISLGHDSLDELRNEITHDQNISSNTLIIAINNEEMGQKYAQIEIINPQASSISEIVANFLKDLRIPIDEDIAFNLYSGIKWATKMFAPKFVKSSTFNTAQYLIEFGAGKSSLAENAQKVTSEDFRRPEFVQSLTQGLASSDLQFSPNLKPKKMSDFISQKTKHSDPPDVAKNQLYSDKVESPIEDVEVEHKAKESWLKPPKVYRGSKSFDRDS